MIHLKDVFLHFGDFNIVRVTKLFLRSKFSRKKRLSFINFFFCRCVCQKGYTGKNCESVYVPCSPDPCENGGYCREIDPYNYQCTCPQGMYKHIIFPDTSVLELSRIIYNPACILARMILVSHVYCSQSFCQLGLQLSARLHHCLAYAIQMSITY